MTLKKINNFFCFFTLKKTLIIIIPLLASIVVFWKFIIVYNVPFRLDYAEGFVFFNTISVLKGLPIYQSVESAPYVFGFYTPLYNYIGAFFLKFFGSDINVLRILSFIFYLATGISLSFIIKKITNSLYVALLSGFLFYSSFIVSQWSSIARPDMLGILFITLGIIVIVKKNQKNSTRIIFTALFFALAFFSKQNFIFAPLAFFLSLLFRNKKEAFSFAGVYALLLTFGIALLHVMTNGEFTKQIFIYPGLVPYNNFYAAFRISTITAITALPLILIAIKKVINKPNNFFSIYFLCSLLTFIMLIRDGGIQNYLLEFILSLILIASISVPWEKIQYYKSKQVYPLIFIILFFFSLWSFTSFPWETKTYISERLKIFNSEIKKIKSGSKIIVEDPLVAIKNNSEIEIDPYTYGQVSESGQIPKTSFLTDLRNGKYEYVDDYGAFNRIPEFMNIIDTHFQAIYMLKFSKKIKPFDYSLYNRNKFNKIGALYKYKK